MKVGVVHPGEMGAAIGAALVGAGRDVSWASGSRSDATAARAAAAGLADEVTLEALVAKVDLVLSVCPPHAAVDVATAVAAAGAGRSDWTYVDANAISPSTAERVAEMVVRGGARSVDGGIIGPPPVDQGTTRLYLSGADAIDVSAELATPLVEVHVLGEVPGNASALKLAYAAWTKGSAALLLSAREAARRAGVETFLLQEWRTSQPDLARRCEASARAAQQKGWRWVGEMEEIASMFSQLGLADGFHVAAAEVFRLPFD